MRNRRARTEGGSYLFTPALADRSSNLLTTRIEIRRGATRSVRLRHPFTIDAAVVLLDHPHCIWTMPAGDLDYSTRWALIKAGFSRALPKPERISTTRQHKRERGVWQRRFWEHQIRDDRDLSHHVEYIHHNPVKHGYVTKVRE